MGLRDAVTFGPPLVKEGKPMITKGDGGWGYAPRTAIGQRNDGAILLMVIDGRQAASVGASLKEVQDLMLQFGVVTASNLDGGSSTCMVYQGKVVNRPSSGYGERPVPTFFVVTGEDL